MPLFAKTSVTPKLKIFSNIMNDLYNHHYNIIFCWIPSHVGIKGNTKADKLARITPISSTHVIPIAASDAHPTLQNYINTKWQATWDYFPNNMLYKISPRPTFSTIAPLVF